jgi:hypothetical protein
MRRKTHPADLAEAAIVSQAVRYEISLFVNGRFETATALTLGEAREKAADLLARHPTSRRPLIYGIDAEGRRGLVTETTPTPAIWAHLRRRLCRLLWLHQLPSNWPCPRAQCRQSHRANEGCKSAASAVPDPNPPRVYDGHNPGEGVVGRVRRLRGSYGAPGRGGGTVASAVVYGWPAVEAGGVIVARDVRLFPLAAAATA